MSLPSQWVDKIFLRLLGVYGAQFKAKFSVIENGVDVGMANAKEVWADELKTFRDWPEAIAYALQHLPTDHAPNAIEFRDICRRTPKKEPVALAYKMTTEDHQRAASAAEAAIRGMKIKISDGIDKHWATHPRSSMHMAAIFSAANRDARFRPCIDEMVEQGICTPEGALLKAYRDGSFVKA